MPEITFIYKGKAQKILCQPKDIIKKAIKIFINISNIQNKTIIYLFNGEKINDENLTFENLAKDKVLTILAYDIDIENNILQSTEVICPECKCSSILTIKDYKLNITCINNHKFNNILIKEFPKTQEINYSKIICNICKNKIRNNEYDDVVIFRCSVCKINLCENCKIKHDQNHRINKL